MPRGMIATGLASVQYRDKNLDTDKIWPLPLCGSRPVRHSTKSGGVSIVPVPGIAPVKTRHNRGALK